MEHLVTIGIIAIALCSPVCLSEKLAGDEETKVFSFVSGISFINFRYFATDLAC